MRKEYKKYMGHGKRSIICIIYMSGKTRKWDGVEVIFEALQVYEFLKLKY